MQLETIQARNRRRLIIYYAISQGLIGLSLSSVGLILNQLNHDNAYIRPLAACIAALGGGVIYMSVEIYKNATDGQANVENALNLR